MKLQKIKVDGYKNIDKTEIVIDKIVALVGINNYGKSNFLEALDFSQQFIKRNPEKKEKMMSYVSSIPTNKNMVHRNFTFEMEYSTNICDKNVLVNYMFSFKWVNKNNDGCRIVEENLKIKENEKGKKYNMIIKRNFEEALFKSSETGRCDRNIKINDNDLVINKLKYSDELFYIDVIKEINNITFDLNKFMDTEDTFRTVPIEMKNEPIFKLDKCGVNIAKIINYLSEKEESRYKLLKNAFLKLFPNIIEIIPKSIPISIDDKEKELIDDDAPFKFIEKINRILVKDKNLVNPTDFKNLSNGTKRVFLLLTAAILADQQGIQLIMFEELENCIHPKLFKQLIDTLDQITNNCKILITSHSPHLITYLKLKNIYIGENNEKGVATFKSIKSSKIKSIYDKSKQNKISVGEYIFKLLDNNKKDEINSLLEESK